MIITSSLFSHIFIPLAILFIFSDKLKIEQRKIIILSFFGILPDADIFLFHRADFHNIFILIIPFLIFIFAKYRETSGIICFYLISHLILDIFNGGIFLLYPVYDNVFFVSTEIWFNYSGITPIIDYGVNKSIVNNGRGDPMISSENIGIIVILVMFVLLTKIRYQISFLIRKLNVILNK